MSEPITWRSVSAPNFGASAALLNSGGETLNQGITSLANLATGIADKQKGIEVSNAVAALGKAANDSERGAIFDAQAANLRDQGIDLKDLIAADQARHLALNSDATLKSNLAMNDSNLAGNALTQAGQGIENKTLQGALDYQKTDQEQKIAAAAQSILESNSNMRTNESQAASSALSASASAANSNDAISERAIDRSLTTDTSKAITLGLTMSQSKEFQNANGTGIDLGKFMPALDAAGVSGENKLKIMTAVNITADKDAKTAAVIKQAENLREDNRNKEEDALKVKLANIEKPMSTVDFNSRASEVAKSLTGAWSFMEKSTLEGQIKTLASSVGQAKAMSIVGDSLGSDGNIDFVKLNTNIGKASLQKTASEDNVSIPN
jgi:hypothetical protein